MYASCEWLDSFLIGQEHVKNAKATLSRYIVFSIVNKKVPFSYLLSKLPNDT